MEARGARGEPGDAAVGDDEDDEGDGEEVEDCGKGHEDGVEEALRGEADCDAGFEFLGNAKLVETCMWARRVWEAEVNLRSLLGGCCRIEMPFWGLWDLLMLELVIDTG